MLLYMYIISYTDSWQCIIFLWAHIFLHVYMQFGIINTINDYLLPKFPQVEVIYA